MTEAIREPTSADLDTALARLGYTAFRPGQREAVETLLAHRRLLLVAPTGGGKSLSYQLPATLLAGTTLVISPLVALMADQVQALDARGVPATYLAATLDAAEMRRRMARLAAGAFSLVYVAPERLAFPGFRGLIRELDVPLVAVDEAHCISEWGHDFRPDYRTLLASRYRLGRPPAVALTGSATPAVRRVIARAVGVSDCK
ncbi:MAG: DEAD/DEAH box helicase, partial [Candidatus Rokuibacteriota bacterium]